MLNSSQIRQLALPLVLFVLAGCDSGGGEGGDAASTGEAGGGAAPAAAYTTSADGQMTIDMDAIFPQGPGRDILLNNCQSCHTWVPVVVLGMNEDEWARWRQDHRQRVPGIPDEQFEVLYEYLVTNFNPDTPVPDLPPALLESWTTY